MGRTVYTHIPIIYLYIYQSKPKHKLNQATAANVNHIVRDFTLWVLDQSGRAYEILCLIGSSTTGRASIEDFTCRPLPKYAIIGQT